MTALLPNGLETDDPISQCTLVLAITTAYYYCDYQNNYHNCYYYYNYY